MKLVPKQEALQWCQGRGIKVHLDVPRSSRLRFDGGLRALRIGIKGSAVEVINLAYVLLMTGVADDDESRFDGALIWLRDWDIWSAGIEQVGHLLLTGVRGPDGPSVSSAPGHVFGSGELVAARAALALPMLFQWDAVLAPAHGRFIATVSHDGYFDLLVPDVESEAAMVARFKVGGYPMEQLGKVNSE